MNEGHYTSLLRLAFLLFDGANVNDEHRLARAHRLSRKALRRRKTRRDSDPYAAARSWLVRRILVKEHRPCATRLAWRTRTDPPTPQGDAATLREQLRRLPPQQYAAYLLSRLEQLSADMVAQDLAGAWAARVRRRSEDPLPGSTPKPEEPNARTEEPHDIEAALATIDDATGLGPERQHELLTGPDFDPSRPRVAPRTRLRELGPWHTSRGRLLTAATCALLVAVAATVTGVRLTGDEPMRAFTTVSAQESRDELEHGPDFHGWPTAGNLRHDTELLQRAAITWGSRGGDVDLQLQGEKGLPVQWWPEASKVQVLFAGEVQGSTVVLMYVGAQGVVARYVRTDESLFEEPDEELAVMPVDSEDERQHMGPLRLTPDGEEGFRILVPPWLSNVQYAALDGGAKGWRPVAVRDGVATIEPDFEPHGCSSGALLRGTFTDEDGERSKRTYIYHEDLPYPIQVTSADGEPVTLGGSRTREKLRSRLCAETVLLDFLPVSSVQLDEPLR